MEWIKCRGGHIGKKTVELRTLRVTDNSGVARRFRACSVFSPGGDFSRIPASGRLFRSENGFIGVFVEGKNYGYVKIGKRYIVRNNLTVALNAISKKALIALTKDSSIYISDFDGTLIGMEK